MPTTFWSPNQSAIAQVETYTFTVPSSVGNTYTATINGKSVTYTSVSGDTAATAATGLYNLLNASTSLPAELTEITFDNPSSGVITATARTPGTPFADITINGVSGQGLVMSTGNGLSDGITTTHTTPNYSPSDVYDAQNWLRVVAPAPGVRALPQSGDDIIVSDTATPLLWNLDRLSTVQFASYTRYQSFTGTIGLPDANPNGYAEWRATYFKFDGPAGSVPSGGLPMVLGVSTTGGGGPSRERYDLQSSPVTVTVLASGGAADEYGVRFKSVHTGTTFQLGGGVSLGIAMLPGEVANLTTCTVTDGTLGVGVGVTWTAGSTLTMQGGSAVLNAAPATLTLNNGSQATITEDQLTWATVTAQGGSAVNFNAGGTVTTLTLSAGASLDKSGDSRALTITNSTMDGDTCFINDPYNSITFTNATSVKQQVTSGPIRFTGTRTVKVT